MNRYKASAKLRVSDSFQAGTPLSISVQDPRPYAAEEYKGEAAREIRVSVKCAESGPAVTSTVPPQDPIEFTLEYEAPSLKAAFEWGREELEARADVLAFMTLRHVALQADRSCVEVTPGKTEDLESLIGGASVPAPGIVETEVLRHVMGGTAFAAKITPRIAGSLRWFRKGLGAEMPEDAFLALWIALEMVAPDFGSDTKRYMFCHRCQTSFEKCPSCGQSTEGRPQAGEGIVRLFQDHLGWPKTRFRDVNALRAKLVHGNVRLSEQFRVELLDGIGTLKEALVTAYEVLLELGRGRHPFRGRLVLPDSFGVQLQVTFRLPEGGGASMPIAATE